MSAQGIPVVAVNIIAGDAPAVKVEIGNTATVTVQNGAATKDYTGEVLAIELGNKPFYGARDRMIYDGLATSEYSNPVAAMIDNAADVMEVNAILLKVDEEHIRVPIGRIKTISVG